MSHAAQKYLDWTYCSTFSRRTCSCYSQSSSCPSCSDFHGRSWSASNGSAAPKFNQPHHNRYGNCIYNYVRNDHNNIDHDPEYNHKRNHSYTRRGRSPRTNYIVHGSCYYLCYHLTRQPVATPSIDRLNQMQDRSEEEHIQSCIICSRSSLNFRDSTP